MSNPEGFRLRVLVAGSCTGLVAGAFGFAAVNGWLWNLFTGEHGEISPMVYGFAFWKGAVLGAVSGYALALNLLRQRRQAGRVCFAFGLVGAAVVVLVSLSGLLPGNRDPDYSFWRLFLIWDAMTLVWATVLLKVGLRLRTNP